MAESIGLLNQRRLCLPRVRISLPSFFINYLNNFYLIISRMFLILLDIPRRFQMSFQDAASPVMSAILDLHSYISFFLILILIFVAFQIFDVLNFFRIDRNYNVNKRPYSFLRNCARNLTSK